MFQCRLSSSVNLKTSYSSHLSGETTANLVSPSRHYAPDHHHYFEPKSTCCSTPARFIICSSSFSRVTPLLTSPHYPSTYSQPHAPLLSKGPPHYILKSPSSGQTSQSLKPTLGTSTHNSQKI